jgi:hypothetical protein
MIKQLISNYPSADGSVRSLIFNQPAGGSDICRGLIYQILSIGIIKTIGKTILNM